MYHLASAFVFVPASLIVLARSPDQKPFTVCEQRIDPDEEDHRRRQPCFLPTRPCDLRYFASDLTEKLQRACATTRGRRQFLACSFCRFLCRFSHRTSSSLSTGRSGGIRTHGPRFWRPM